MIVWYVSEGIITARCPDPMCVPVLGCLWETVNAHLFTIDQVVVDSFSTSPVSLSRIQLAITVTNTLPHVLRWKLEARS